MGILDVSVVDKTVLGDCVTVKWVDVSEEEGWIVGVWVVLWVFRDLSVDAEDGNVEENNVDEDTDGKVDVVDICVEGGDGCEEISDEGIDDDVAIVTTVVLLLDSFVGGTSDVCLEVEDILPYVDNDVIDVDKEVIFVTGVVAVPAVDANHK